MFTVRNTLEDWTRFADWLNAQVKAQNLSLRALARKAGISHVVVTRMSNAQGSFNVESLNAVADALEVPREKVQQLVGLLPANGEALPEVKGWSARLSALPDGDRQRAIDLMDLALQAIERAGAGR